MCKWTFLWPMPAIFSRSLPGYIVLGQHAVHGHHVKSIGVFPACFQKPLLLQTMHSWRFCDRIVSIPSNILTWSPECPATGRAPLPPESTGGAAGSQSSPGQIDHTCSPKCIVRSWATSGLSLNFHLWQIMMQLRKHFSFIYCTIKQDLPL